MDTESTEYREAIQEGRVADVARLLDARPSRADEALDGISPLLLALFSGQEETARLLVDSGARLDLREAAALGDVGRMEQVLGQNEDGALDAPGPMGWTPLHLAAFLGRAEAVRWLLDRGANPATLSTNREANTALHAALAGRGDLEVIRILIDGGADPASRAALGVTPLHLAASRGNVAAVDLLMDRGATPTAMEDGQLPSAFARDRGHPELAERLEEREERPEVAKRPEGREEARE